MLQVCNLNAHYLLIFSSLCQQSLTWELEFLEATPACQKCFIITFLFNICDLVSNLIWSTHCIAIAGREAAFDMEKPSLAEAGLMEEPVQALRARLAQLLADWPDHPILAQLLVLCDRLLGDHHTPFYSACLYCYSLIP